MTSFIDRGLRGAFAAFLALGLFGCGDDSAGGTSSTSTGAGGGGDIILDGGGTIPESPDGVAACPKGACNYQSGEGCTTDAPTCAPTLTNGEVAPACAAAGEGKSGVACISNTDCTANYLCVDGACHQLCCGGDWGSCPDGESCIRTLQIDTGTELANTDAMLCYPVNTCAALEPAGCDEPGTTCQIVDPRGSTACITEGTGDSGDPCPCKGGFLCVAGACRRLCKAVEGGGEPACEDGEGRCVHFKRDPEGVGECTP